MVADSAFTFVASTKPVGLEHSGRNQDRFGVNEEGRSNKKGSFSASNEPILNIDSFSEILEKLTKAHNQYTNMKKGSVTSILELEGADLIINQLKNPIM